MDAKNVALVLEGGGTRNSYTAPVIQQLIRDDINVGWVGGVSAGSTHFVNYLSKDIDRAKGYFVDFLANPKCDGFG